MVGGLKNSFEEINQGRVPNGMVRRERIDRMIESVVPHISHHVVVAVVGELPIIVTTNIRRRHDGRRLNEDNISTLPHTSRFGVVDPIRLAVHAVPDKASFPSAVLQLLGVGLVVHERPGPDHPKVPKVGILAVERLVRRPVVQGRVWRPVAQEDSRLHQLPPKKLR